MELRPLNIFQRVMRIWEEAHPYNAAQVMHLAGEADLDRITAAWNEVLRTTGLGTARIIGRRFCYEKHPHQEVAVVDTGSEGGLGSGGGMEGFISRELNRPFGDAEKLMEMGRSGTFTTMPFRAFVVMGKGTHHLGVVYQHWVADSVAMRMVLREWFCRLYDPARVSGGPLQPPKGGFWRYFGPGRGGWNLMDGAMSVVRSLSEFSTARRIDEESGGQEVECSIHQLPEGMIDALLEVTRRRRAGGGREGKGAGGGVTLNDLFLAALARACDEYGAAPRRSHRDLALGTIVDLRATSSESLENTFGMFLGFTSLVVRADLLRDRDRLLTSIASENARQKESRTAQASMLRMAVGYAQGRFLSPQRLARFYRDYMPLSGGVSNVNMNRSWAAEYHPSPLLDYLRVAPTGPMVPVVIAVTTIGRRLSFVLTRRASLVDRESGARLAGMFVDELTARAKMG